MDLIGMLTEPARRAGLEARSLAAIARAGVIGLETPQTLASVVQAMIGYGPLGSAPRIAALRHGDLPAIADERGELTFTEFDEQINRCANALTSLGVEPGAGVGILCRNHRAPLVAAFAASRNGMNAIWLNTAFSPRQAREVSEREGVNILIHDAEFADVVAEIEPAHGKIVTFTDDDPFDALIAAAEAKMPPPPKKAGRLVLLTSGTTGTPKGAARPEPRSLTIPGALLDRMPMKAEEATVVGPPLYHGTGLVIALLTISLGSKLILRRRFEPRQFLDDLADNHATGACVVPIMLQRVLALGPEEIQKRDLTNLRVVFCAGSQLPAEVALAFMDQVGDVIYNLYGSTEVSVATLATPSDIRKAPTSVGKPALAIKVKILDDHGKEVPQGSIGRIFVGAISPFEGYTGGGGKEVISGLMSTGDVGHFDRDGLLYIDGRDDEMIVSGGENVFPREVEELLITHPSIADVAVIGVEDEEFGQRLKAFVVKAPGKRITVKQAQDFVKDNLARYKVPREVVFMKELPRNPTGKVLKRELAAD
jgi:fatty-acyl-CoA synthase